MIHFVLAYRQTDAFRIRNIDFTIKTLLSYNIPDSKILVIEQDRHSKFINKYNVDYTFISNPNLFNKSWAYNVAVKKYNLQEIIFIDIDIFLHKHIIEEIISLKYTYDSINPFNKFIMLPENLSRRFIDTMDPECLRGDGYGCGANYAGGAVYYNRKALETIGMWEEGFKGWGAEDDAMTIKSLKYLKHHTLNYVAFHLYHPKVGQYGNPNYYNNYRLFQELSRMSPEKMKLHMEESLKSCGNENYK